MNLSNNNFIPISNFDCITGAVVYLLNIFCSSADADTREKTAELLGKMTCDKLVGPKVRLILNKVGFCIFSMILFCLPYYYV